MCIRDRYYPFTGVPGHEFVGIVESSPDPEQRGKRVVGEINAVCGKCPTCAAGRSSHCEARTVLGIVKRNGAFAERLALPPRNLHVVPEGVTDEEAVFVEPLAAALEIQQQVRITKDDRVLVVGDGKLGNLIAQPVSCSVCASSAVTRPSATCWRRAASPPSRARWCAMPRPTSSWSARASPRGWSWPDAPSARAGPSC